MARRFGCYGYRMVTGMLRTEGWAVNHKRVERIWRQEGLKVPSKQPKRGRLWLTDGSCIRLRPLYQHHVWAYDFVSDRTHDGRPTEDADSAGRAHEGVPGDRGGSQDPLARRARGAGRSVRPDTGLPSI